MPALFDKDAQLAKPQKSNSAKTFTLPSSRIKIISRSKVSHPIEVPPPGNRRAAPTRRNTESLQGTSSAAQLIISPRSRGLAREEADS